MSTILPSKDPEETIVVTFNFAREMAPTETIESCTVTVTVQEGRDPSPQDIRQGDPDTEAAPGKALQAITGGLDGVTYKIKAKAVLDSGRPLVRMGILPVATA